MVTSGFDGYRGYQRFYCNQNVMNDFFNNEQAAKEESKNELGCVVLCQWRWSYPDVATTLQVRARCMYTNMRCMCLIQRTKIHDVTFKVCLLI